MTAPARYQTQDSPQTLEEGLAEYYARNAERVTPPAQLPPESAALFRSHDICHVIFGLDTTLIDEALTDTRTVLSCDVGWRRYARYLETDPQAKRLFAELGLWRTLAWTLAATPRILRAALEATRMRRRWPWQPPPEFAGRALHDLRRDFGIRVI